MMKIKKRHLIGFGLLLLLAGWIAYRFQNPLVPESDRVSYSWRPGEPGSGLRGIVTDGQGNPLFNTGIGYDDDSGGSWLGRADGDGCFAVTLPGDAFALKFGWDALHMPWISRHRCDDMVLTLVIRDSR